MAEDTSVAKVKVSKQTLIMPQPDTTVLYPEGFEGTAPHAHIDLLVKSGNGQRQGDQSQRTAENQDAFKSGSDNASV
jgi:hypothetical protein